MMNYKKLIPGLFLCTISIYSFGQKKSVEKRLDSLFNALAAQNQFSGSVLIAEQGKVLYKAGKGYRNELTKAPNNPRTVFELASCSKQFVGAGIALLHREGKINYTDDITRYLPELSNFRGVSIYDLLRHTSGIPEYLDGFREDWKQDKIATNTDLIHYYAQRKDTLEFAPNAKHAYCNTNYAFLATIIERASGQDLDRYLSDRIFKPLKMDRTFIYNRRLAPRDLKNYAYGYVWIKNSFEKATEDDNRVGEMMSYYMDGIVGNAKVNSTVEDMYKWINALKSNQLLSPEEFNEIMTISRTGNNKAVNYGFGFEVRKKDGKLSSYGHTGSWDGYIALSHYSVGNDRTIIILNNFDKGICPYEEITGILDHKPLADPAPQKINLPEAALRQFEGEYVDPGDTSVKHLISYLDHHLIYNTDKINWDMRFFPTSGNTFQAIRQGGADGVLKFTRQSDGTIRLAMTQYGEKIGEGIRK
ncbi:MAG: class A beta-lactamase-related serine hydrolase [Sphingobacteriales bacterium]|nr:MAG: class A beta-lactamase-related serine hydrolase [Sphingobacteriales bacterium]